VIGDRRAQQPQVELPISVIAGEIHRFFHRFVRLEKLTAIKESNSLRQAFPG
jgi:hypothetical protein